MTEAYVKKQEDVDLVDSLLDDLSECGLDFEYGSYGLPLRYRLEELRSIVFKWLISGGKDIEVSFEDVIEEKEQVTHDNNNRSTIQR